MAVFYVAALSKQRVGLVEQENGAALFRRIEHTPQVFLCFSDVLADYGREVDPVDIQPQIIGQDFRRHRFARAARPREQRADAQPARSFRRKPPTFVNLRAMPHVRHDVPQNLHLRLGKHQVLPAVRRVDALRQIGKPRARMQPAGVPQPAAHLPRVRLLFAFRNPFSEGFCNRRPHPGGIDVELRNQPA